MNGGAPSRNERSLYPGGAYSTRGALTQWGGSRMQVVVVGGRNKKLIHRERPKPHNMRELLPRRDAKRHAPIISRQFSAGKSAKKLRANRCRV